MNARTIPSIAAVVCLAAAFYYFSVEKHPWAGVASAGLALIMLTMPYMGIARTKDQQALLIIIGLVLFFLGAGLDQGIRHFLFGQNEPPASPYP